MSVEIAFLIGMAVLLLMAVKFNINAFISLITAAFIIGMLAGMDGAAVIKTIINGFSKTIGSIGIIIIFGVMLGKYLEESGAANRLALGTVNLVGPQRSSLAMAISGYLVSIPVFSDVGYVILAPLARSVARKTGKSFAVLAVSLSAGLLATHVYVPPTPGPLAAAGMLHIDLGRAILWGAFAAIFMTLAGWLFAELVISKMKNTDPVNIPVNSVSSISENDLPGGFSSLFPLMIPLILILLNTTTKAIYPKDSNIVSLFNFIGDSNVALMIGVVSAILLLGKRMGWEKVLKLMDVTLKDAGPIIFITAAGGAMGEILKDSGAGKALSDAVVKSGMPFILLPFGIAAILKIVQGSGTVAVVTAASLSAPLAMEMGMDPILIFLASGAGARSLCHVNDSYFWVYANMGGFDLKTGLRTLSFSNIFMALGGLFATYLASLILA
jgi:GntP family gluconate:H+ symporter